MKQSKYLEYATKLQRRVQHLDVLISVQHMFVENKYKYSFIVVSRLSDGDQLFGDVNLSKTIDENVEVIKDWLKPKKIHLQEPDIKLIGKTVYYQDKPYTVCHIASKDHFKLKELGDLVWASDCYILN